MTKTLVIGDLHLSDKVPGLLKAQIKCLTKIVQDERYFTRNLIFMGDLVTNRRPTATVLLQLKFFLERCKDLLDPFAIIHILRGNHDSENKSDDGTTVLSLYNALAEIYVRPGALDDLSFIPHYENEDRIRAELADVPKGQIVFGHFGYTGCLNSAGDEDFTIPVSAFKNQTILGHIHKYKVHKNITVVGTPYTTGYNESGKECKYLILDGSSITSNDINHGPRYVVMPFEKLEENLDYLNDPNYFTLLRVLLNSFDETENISQFLNEKLKVAHIDIKYKPQFREVKDMPDLGDSEFTVSVNQEFIDKYISESSTNLNREELLAGLKLVYEDK